MAVQTTPNLGLTLPYQSDPVAVSEQNGNMTLIDTAFGALPSGKTVQGQINEFNSNLTNYINAETQNLTYANATMELINGTGTVRNTPLVAYNDQYVSVTGVARFSGFSRTGSNPGIKITLPVNVATLSRYDALMTTASGSEFATLAASGNTVRVTISETFSNYSSPYMLIVFPNIVLRRA